MKTGRIMLSCQASCTAATAPMPGMPPERHQDMALCCLVFILPRACENEGLYPYPLSAHCHVGKVQESKGVVANPSWKFSSLGPLQQAKNLRAMNG